MVDYCNENGLVLNGQKTQILTSARKQILKPAVYNTLYGNFTSQNAILTIVI